MIHSMPGHFHMTVAGPVFLAIIGMSIYLYSKTSGKRIYLPKINVIIPYLWLIGVLTVSFLMGTGFSGENGGAPKPGFFTALINAGV